MAIPKTFLILLAGTLSLLSFSGLGIPNSLKINAFNNKNPIFAIKPVQASEIGYKPPIRKNPRRSQGSGSRGDCNQLLLANSDLIKLLIPSKEYAGQTIASHPTFFLNLVESISIPMEFALVKPGVAEPIFVKTIENASAGIIKIELPENTPSLQTGEIYKWSVSLVCNQRRPSANPLFYSWIERVATQPELSAKLAQINPSDSDKVAAIYGEAGLWYDTLSELENNQIEFNSLLKKTGLIFQ